MKLFLRFTCALVLLFSVASGAQNLPSTTWTQVSTAQSPTARSYGAMTYDIANQKVLLFGGFDGTKNLDDTWSFDGTNWTQLHPASSPPARNSASMAFDRRSNVVVLFGGFNSPNYLNDTWVWDGSAQTWTQASPTHVPTAVTGPMLFADPLNGRVDVFGGYDGRFYQATQYQWTGADWRQLSPSTVPYARSIALYGNDLKHKTVVMFGGLADLNPNNTWTWDGTNWTEVFPAVQPPHLYGPGAAWDAHLKGVISFGGGVGGVDQTDTWAWTGSNWVQLSPTSSPAAREGEGTVYDAATATLYIFGGETGNGAGYFNDTWKLTP